jgi:hypothetical protein
MKKIPIILSVLLLIFAAGCTPEPDPHVDMADGIVIYSNREILNNREVEIVVNRVQRLMAVSPSGHIIEWHSTNPIDIQINEFGVIRTSRTPNREAVITASSTVDPSLKAQVIFRTRGLR